MLTPPRTRIEDTVLDLIECSRSFDEAYDWICRAIGRRRTTAERVRAALDARPRFRWRRDIELALGDASDGALSLLELRYVRGVERPHGLPAAKRQARGQAADRQSIHGQPLRGLPGMCGTGRNRRPPRRRAMAR
ncbi:MAG TPA: hypothetical protein VMG13_03290 [Trebonia sp.]|nr:hypothetical protein [Trebonia sp.]